LAIPASLVRLRRSSTRRPAPDAKSFSRPSAWPKSSIWSKKNRLPASAYDKLRQALNVADYVIEEAPLTAGIVEAMKQVPRVDVPDMPDRIVAGTGVYFGVPVISRDGRIRASSIQTVW
jgi:hypothetical protein